MKRRVGLKCLLFFSALIAAAAPVQAQTVTLSPPSLYFQSQFVGTTSSPALQVYIINYDASPLTIASMVASPSGVFGIVSNGCLGVTLTTKSSCSFSVTFSPQSPGTINGFITIADNAPDSPQTVFLTGIGVAPQPVHLSPTSLDFGTQPVGVLSAHQTLWLVNSDINPVTINSIVISPGVFALDGTICSGTLGSGSSCYIGVTFFPSTPGVVNGSVTVNDSGSNSPQVATLTGTGVLDTPIGFKVSSSPTSVTTKDTSAPTGGVILTATNSGALSAGTVINITFSAPLFPSGASGCFSFGRNCSISVSGNVYSIMFPTGAIVNVGDSTGGSSNFNPQSFGIGTVTASISVSPSTAATFSPTTVPAANVSGYSVVSLSTTSLDFGNVLVGESSTQTLTLANNGNGLLSLGGFVLNPATPPNFTESDNCVNNLSPGQSCSINVTFTPQWTGLFTASFAVGTQTVSLTGTGTGPIASLSATSLNFGSHNVGSSGVLPVTFANTGTAPLTIGTIATTNPVFTQSNNCPGSLAPGADCTVNVTFAPSAPGTFSGALTITDNGLGGAQTITLIGNGSGVTLTLSPAGLDFGDQHVGTISPPQTVTLTNSGAVPLTISAIATTFSAFSESNNCPESVAPGASCTIKVTFTPPDSGPFQAYLTISDSAAGGPHLVALSGTGLHSGGLSLSKISLDFGSQPIGMISSPLNVNLTNFGTTPDVISSIATTSPHFGETHDCGATIVPGATCTVSVTFSPSATGAVVASLYITDSTSGVPQVVTLIATGFDPTQAAIPPRFDFGNQPVGTSSPQIQITLGPYTKFFMNLVLSLQPDDGAFVGTTDCPPYLFAPESCTVNLGFAPKAAQSYSSLFTLDGVPDSITLTGTGVPNSGPVSNLSAVIMNFLPQQVNVVAVPQTVTLSNTGTAPLIITGFATTPSEFAQANNCPSSLAPSESCTIDIFFTPATSTTTTGFLTITDNAPDSPKTMNLRGVGIPQSGPLPDISPAKVGFGYQVVGTTSAPQTIQVANNTLGPIDLTGIVPSPGVFVQSNTCPSTLAANTKCNVIVTFTPTQVGTFTASLYIAENIPGSVQTVTLTGQGVSPGPVASVSPASLKFGSQRVATSSSPQSVTLTNTGTAALAITSMAFSSGDFVENNTCGNTLAVGATCTVVVMFNPTAAGPLTGTLIITDNGPGSPQTVALTGTGTPNPLPALSLLSPAIAAPGSAGVNLTVMGTNFIFSSVVQWNGTDLSTTFVSSTELTAFVPSSDLVSPGSVPVAVSNPAPGGGVSNARTFNITAAAATPIPAGAVQTIVPHSAFGGGWITRLFVANLTNAPNTVTINRIDQRGNVIASETTTLGPAAMFHAADDESLRILPLTINWFAIGSQAPVTASVLFDFQGAAAPSPVTFNTAVGALASPPLAAFTALARVTSPGGDLGLALANLNNTSNTVTIRLYDEGGNLVAQDSVILVAYSQTAFDLTQDPAFSNILQSTNEFVGTLTATTSDPTKPVSALVVGANLNQLFTFPVVSGVAK